MDPVTPLIFYFIKVLIPHKVESNNSLKVIIMITILMAHSIYLYGKENLNKYVDFTEI